MKKMFLFGLLGTALTAQAADMDTLKSVELQDVQVVSIRASKKTPMAYTDMNKEQLKAVNFGKDVPYLLSLTPSVTMTSDAGNGIGYTTLRVRGTDPSRINITANGIPMNDAESAQLFWVNMGDFASSVQSMQIQRGVGTSTNGAGAFGATINMLTENIGIKPFVGIDLSGGSYYSHKETLRFVRRTLGHPGPIIEHRIEGLSGPCQDKTELLFPTGWLLRRQYGGEVHHVERCRGDLPRLELHVEIRAEPLWAHL